MAADDDVIFGNLRVSRKRPFGEVDDDDRGLRERFTFKAEGPLAPSPWRKGGGKPPAVPIKTANPVVSGTATVGSTLSATNGTWSNSPTSYAYQWFRAGVAIGGATAATYVLVAADSGKTVTCQVAAKNANGWGVAISNGVAIA